MRNRAFRPVATILSLLLVTAAPVQAGPVGFADVIEVIGESRGEGWQTASLRFRYLGPGNKAKTGDLSPQQGPSGAHVQVEEVTEITVEDCSCDESDVMGVAFLAGGGLPLPLLTLGAVPLLFISGEGAGGGSGSGLTPVNTSTPTFTFSTTPPPAFARETPVPEPATLLLLGAGLAALGAGAGRRRARLRAVAHQAAAMREG